LLRNSRSFRNTARWSGCSGRSGKVSRNRLITEGLDSRKKVLISFSSPKFVTIAVLVSCRSVSGSNALARLLSGSRSKVNRRLLQM
jgi:hypothetical protein